MPLDVQLFIKLLRLILLLLEAVPADYNHTPIACTAREILENFFPHSLKGGKPCA